MIIHQTICFNPCFIGTYSFTSIQTNKLSMPLIVLILVLLELILLHIWKLYPNKKDKAKAYKYIKRILTKEKISAEELERAVKRYAKEKENTEEQHIIQAYRMMPREKKRMVRIYIDMLMGYNGDL